MLATFILLLSVTKDISLGNTQALVNVESRELSILTSPAQLDLEAQNESQKPVFKGRTNDMVCQVTSALSGQCGHNVKQEQDFLYVAASNWHAVIIEHSCNVELKQEFLNLAEYSSGAMIIKNLTSTCRVWAHLINSLFRNSLPSLQPPSVVIDRSKDMETSWCFQGSCGFLTIHLSHFIPVHGFIVTMKNYNILTKYSARKRIQVWGSVEEWISGEKLRKAASTVKMRNDVPIAGAGTAVLLADIQNNHQHHSQSFGMLSKISNLDIPFRIISFIIEDVEHSWKWHKYTCVQQVEVYRLVANVLGQ